MSKAMAECDKIGKSEKGGEVKPLTSLNSQAYNHVMNYLVIVQAYSHVMN
jgi:hypothetical protein